MRALIVSDGELFLLSDKEKAILEVISEAERSLSVKEICDRAGCTTRTYQYFMSRKNFRSLLAPALNYMVEQSLIPIFGSLLSKARNGSQKHQELLFKVLGLLRENRTEITNIFNIFQKEDKWLSEGEIDQLLGV